MKNYILIILTVSFLSACSNDSDKKALLAELKMQQAQLKEKIAKLEAELKDTTSESKQKLVAVTEMKPQPFIHFIEVQAKVEGDEDVMLSAEAAGTVTSINVKAGDRVSVGQVLATIDDKILMQGISELQSQLDLATEIFNRQKNLWDQKIGSEVQFLQAKTNKQSMERRMATLQEQLDMTRIKSPIRGTIDEVRIKVGQTVAPGMPTIRVVNLDALKVKGELAESFINRVSNGNDVILFFPDQQKEIKTKIDYSGNRIDPINRTFSVEVRLAKNITGIRPNMIAVLKVADYSNSNAFTLPINAVQKSSDGEFVYVAIEENGKIVAKRKTVETGMTYNGISEINKGLEEGNKVITTGFQNIIEGDPIKL